MSDQDSLVAPRELEAADPDPTKGGDVYGWAMKQTALIRAGHYDEVDWINVADEIDTSGLRAVRSNLQVLLTHTLKWDHQPERRSASWVSSIDVHRAHVEVDMSDNPSLKSKVVGIIASAYKAARPEACGQTNLPLKTFPETCPYDWDAIMTRPFVLDQTDETA